jgi:hypothetical protein
VNVMLPVSPRRWSSFFESRAPSRSLKAACARACARACVRHTNSSFRSSPHDRANALHTGLAWARDRTQPSIAASSESSIGHPSRHILARLVLTNSAGGIAAAVMAFALMSSRVRRVHCRQSEPQHEKHARVRVEIRVRVRVEIMGPRKYEHVGKSQSVLMMINPIISTRTRSAAAQHGNAGRPQSVHILHTLVSPPASLSACTALGSRGAQVGDMGHSYLAQLGGQEQQRILGQVQLQQPTAASHAGGQHRKLVQGALQHFELRCSHNHGADTLKGSLITAQRSQRHASSAAGRGIAQVFEARILIMYDVIISCSAPQDSIDSGREASRLPLSSSFFRRGIPASGGRLLRLLPQRLITSQACQRLNSPAGSGATAPTCGRRLPSEL